MIKKRQLSPDILFVVNDFGFFKTHRLGIVEYLIDKGMTVSVLTNLSNANSSDLTRMNHKKITLINFNFDRASINPFLNLYYLLRLFHLLVYIKPKKLSLISAKPAVLGGICALFLRFESVFFSITGLGYAFISNSLQAKIVRRILLFIYRIIFKQNNIKVIFQNPDDKEDFIKKGLVDSNKSILIKGNGIDTELYKRSNYPSKLTFLFASRLLIDKGIREFIKCSERISGEDAVFKVAGERDDINPNGLTEEEFEILNKSKNIEYLGKVEHSRMPELFNSASVFVLPSYREGIPQVALEAASSGMPLILNNVTGCRDCLIENENGFLARKGDYSDLLTKMRLFIEDPSLIHNMGRRSREFTIKNFSKELIYKQFLDLYEN
tara:strand:- start:1485 stop:2627 length:1143 start_codon:yes stop_codon:yes gene_type:complete